MFKKKVTAKQLAKFIKDDRLDLTEKKIGDAGLTALAELLKENNHITSLELFGNEITDQGIDQVNEIIKNNPNIKTLRLEFNALTSHGGEKLAYFLKTNNSLTSVDLYGNKIGDRGCIAIAEMIAMNTTLTSLGLFGNQIENAGGASLCEALRRNMHLKKINLDNNDIDDEITGIIEDLLRRNNGEKIRVDDLPDEYVNLVPVALRNAKQESKDYEISSPKMKRTSNYEMGPYETKYKEIGDRWDKDRKILQSEIDNLKLRVRELEIKNDAIFEFIDKFEKNARKLKEEIGKQ